MGISLSEFIKLPIGGSGSKGVPCYGLYYKEQEKLLVYEVNDPENPFAEAEAIKAGEEPNIKKMVFNGIYVNAGTGYKDSSTNKAIVTPIIYFETGNASDNIMGGTTNVLDYLEITVGCLFIFNDYQSGLKLGMAINKHMTSGDIEVNGYAGGEY